MILYSNSCSFGAPFQGHTVYPEVVANSLSAKLVNDGIPGSCNRRIIRSTLRSLIQQKNKPTILQHWWDYHLYPELNFGNHLK